MRSGDQDEPADPAVLRDRFGTALQGFLAAQRVVLDRIGPDLAPVADAAERLVLRGGKRLRPAFAYWGWRAAGGADGDEIVTAEASLELLHAGALIHDDVMNASETRRGHPAAHRAFTAAHRDEAWHGDPAAFGTAAAILLGDLCLVWADAMLAASGLGPAALGRGRPTYDAMRTEVMAGQYLDVLEQASGGGSVERALRVARYKSATYTVERPLQLGAALAGDRPPLQAAFTGFGLPLGEAFQLRDDVLGVFGDPSATGKPAGDDLREGKRTVLIALADQHATAGQAALLRARLGDRGLDSGGIAALREVITATGALDEVESMIERRCADALRALTGTPMASQAEPALRRLAESATARTA